MHIKYVIVELLRIYGVDHIIKRKSVFMKEVHVTKLPKKPKIQS